jgi:hypothetical protein
MGGVRKIAEGEVNIKGWQVYDPFRPDQRAEGISKPSYQQVRVASYERDILDNLKNLPSHSFSGSDSRLGATHHVLEDHQH